METNAVAASGASTYAASSSTTVRKAATSSTTTVASAAVDTFTPSAEGAAASKGAGSSEGTWAGFDMDAFETEMRDKLLAQIRDSRSALKEAGVTFYGGEGTLYDLGGVDTSSYSDKEMGVDEEWGAEATSERIVQFALGFRGSGSASGLSDEEFVAKIRDAIKEGFRLAKQDLGDLPGPTGKLFNDTYQATMDKLDKALDDMKGGTVVQDASVSSTTAPVASRGSTVDLSA